jgi:3-oxoacyl-[acyl-carrier protein] reductase
MEKLIIFGGTGGIGLQLSEVFAETHNVYSLGSKDVNIIDLKAVTDFFDIHSDARVVLNLSGCNYNSFLHKYSCDENIEKQLNVNIVGNINLLRACLPHMRNNKYGRIILSSSILAKRTVGGTSIYSSCKSFIESLVRVVAVENAKQNITINALRMGYMDAGLTYTIPEEYREKIIKEIPCGEFGSIRDLGQLIYCLIETPYINGASLEISGGLNG